MAANISIKKQKEQTVCPLKKVCVMSTVVRRSKERKMRSRITKGIFAGALPRQITGRALRLGSARVRKGRRVGFDRRDRMSGKGKFRIEPFKHRVELDAQVSPRDHRAPAPQFFHESHAPETNFHPTIR